VVTKAGLTVYLRTFNRIWVITLQKLEKTEGVFKHGQSRDTGNIGYTKQMTNKPWRKLKGQTRTGNLETLATLDTQNT
jgi:hypothetical protein